MKRGFIFSINKALSGVFFGVFMLLCVLRSGAQITLTATAGVTTGTYTQLRLAFNAINAGTHQGAITITVTANTTETAAAILNQNGAPASYTSVLIKPAAATSPVISGNIANNGVIYLFGASNVTIDGSNTVGGTTRDLSITNTNAAGLNIRLASPTTLVGATNNTIKNCKIQNTAPLNGVAIVAGSSLTLFAKAEAPNSNNTIENNLITNCQTAFYSNGGDPLSLATAAVDQNWVIKGNDMNNLAFNGITLWSATNSSIVNNVINNVVINGATQVDGIDLSWTVSNLTISGNKITTISNTYNLATPSAEGIYFDLPATVTGNNVFNNFIADVNAFGQAAISDNGHGIYVDGGAGLNFYFNTISLTANPLSAGATTAAICFDPTVLTIAPASVNMVDNIILNKQTSGNNYGVYCNATATSAIFGTMNYNDYFSTSTNLGFVGGAARTSLAAMITGFGGNANSINVAPLLVSATDLHLQVDPANNPLVAGTPIAAPPITVDIDNASRSVAVPTIGAHELLSRIDYTALTNTCSDGDVTLSGVNILSNVGISTAGTLTPRIYFKKASMPGFVSAPGTFVSGSATNGIWSFVISAAAMGGVTAGDVISYFVVAQSTSSTPVVFANPALGFVAVDVNTITTPPTTPNTYTVNAVSITGLDASHAVCYNAGTAQTLNYAYTGSTGTPNQYTLTWSPAGPTAVTAFATLGSPIVVNIPAGTAPGTYTGTITIKNSTTTCTKVYTTSLVVNPLPAAVSGTTLICVGSTPTLTTSSGGGTWNSSNTGVASVGITTGIVTGVAAGTANISYTLPTGCATYIVVTVVAPPAAIAGPSTMCVGTQITLTNSSAGGSWSTASLTATVGASTGIVTAIAGNSATISYIIPGCGAATKLIHIDTLPSTITGPLYACVGATTTLSATPAGGVWTSASPTIATIGSSSGVVTGVATGTAEISYTSTGTGCRATNTVNILPTPAPITGAFLVCQGLTTDLDDAVAGGTWTSNFPGYVTIDPGTGIATGITAGTSATITYMLSSGCQKTATVTVTTPPAPAGPGFVLCTGYSDTLTNGVTGGTWTSMSPTVATVGSASGIVTGITGGTAIISYTTLACGGAAVTYTVTINQTPPPITGITNLCDGGSTTALSDPTPGGAWSICCGSASISPFGVVTGLTLGSVNIVTYTMPNACYTIAPITVDTLPAPIQGPDSVCKFSSVFLFDATAGGVWSSSDGTIATAIAATGQVYGVLAGSAHITYTTVSGCYVTKPFRVSEPAVALANITYFPSLDTLCAGTPVTFTVHGVNGGVAPTYQWEIFGINQPGETDTTFTYTPTHGDVVGVFMTRDASTICSAPAPAHGVVAINVYPNIFPIVNITTTSGSTIGFLGQVVTFFAEVTNAGTTVSYQWIVNGIPVPGATNSSYAREVYEDDDVYCQVSGNPKCDGVSYSAASNHIVIYGSYLGTPTIIAKTSLGLYPNPNTGTFALTGSLASTATQQINIDVTNVLGQVVYKATATAVNGKINTNISLGDDVAAGSYILRVQADTENTTFHFVVGE